MTVHIVRRRDIPTLIDGASIMDPHLSHGALRLYLLWLYQSETEDIYDERSILNASVSDLAKWTAELRDLGYITEDEDGAVILHYPHQTESVRCPLMESPTAQDCMQNEPEHVYLLRSGQYYKIGKARDVEKRMKQLGTLPPFELELVHTITTEAPYEVEADLHGRFADRHVNGEWFLLQPEDVDLIMNYDASRNEADDE